MQYEAKLKSNLRALFSAYCEATGLKISTVSRAVAGDARFHAQRVEGAANFTVRGYDQLVGRFLRIWPKGIPWPEGVPRAEPRELPKRITGRMAAHANITGGQDHGEEAQA